MTRRETTRSYKTNNTTRHEPQNNMTRNETDDTKQEGDTTRHIKADTINKVI